MASMFKYWPCWNVSHCIWLHNVLKLVKSWFPSSLLLTVNFRACLERLYLKLKILQNVASNTIFGNICHNCATDIRPLLLCLGILSEENRSAWTSVISAHQRRPLSSTGLQQTCIHGSRCNEKVRVIFSLLVIFLTRALAISCFLRLPLCHLFTS